MKIAVAKSAGFCFGVKRALDIALEIASSAKSVCMLGHIVHNEDVIREIEKAGINKIRRLGCGKNKILLVRAHGMGSRVTKKAQRLGYKIVDATCPMVKEIHKVAQDMESKGYKIIIIGDKKHDEVRGIIGQLKTKPIVIETKDDSLLRKIKGLKKATVVVQSTQDIDKVIQIVAALKPHIHELKFFNTVCVPTREKQKEVKTMPLENDAMLIIGSKTSANTKRLYEISKSLNPRSFWVQSTANINPAWFKDVQSIGITAGASTPDRTINEIVEFIKRLA